MMNSKFFKIIICILVVIFTAHHAYPTISSDQVRDIFTSINPNDINIETFLEDLATQNHELAEVIKENRLISQSPKVYTTPLIIAHKVNPDWLALLFTIKSNGMDLVRNLHTKVTQRVEKQELIKVVQTYEANFIVQQSHFIQSCLKEMLGLLDQPNNETVIATLLYSPIDPAGNSALNYAVHNQDEAFQGILNIYQATQTNSEFKKFTQLLK